MVTSYPSCLAFSMSGSVSLLLPQLLRPLTLKCEICTGMFAALPIFMASLIASGDVRALCIDQKSFEGLIRERPDVSLVVIKVLSKRLKEATEGK